MVKIDTWFLIYTTLKYQNINNQRFGNKALIEKYRIQDRDKRGNELIRIPLDSIVWHEFSELTLKTIWSFLHIENCVDCYCRLLQTFY